MDKLNERLISKVLDHIKAFPGSYDQNEVASSCSITKKTPCGAIGCFGGWAVLLGMKKSERHYEADNVDLATAEELLGLTSDEADFLFAGGSGVASEDRRTIERRLKDIRDARQLFASLEKNNKLSGVGFTYNTFDGEYLTYGEN